MEQPRRPFVTLTTDFGAGYTGICAGVIHRIAPEATVLVVSDELPKYRVLHGAALLRQALPYLPAGVHVGIVDPGVGTPRRPVALVTGRGDVLVGPDNGLLLPGAEELGGVAAAYHLQNPDYRLPQVSATFHGRDIFSPAAAHLARGVAVTDLGPPIESGSLVVLPLPQPRIAPGRLCLTVLYADEFGSLVLSGEQDDLAAAFGPVPPGTRFAVSWQAPGGEAGVELTYQETFGEVPPGRPLLYLDSSGWLGLAVNQGSAAERFGIGDGEILTLHPLEPTVRPRPL